MRLQIRADYGQICREVALQIAALVRSKPNAVLGLATGSTPLGIYEELIRLHREEGLDFSNVRTFNLDEYFPIAPHSPQSYARFMSERLFSGLNIHPQNCHIPSGLPRSNEEIEADCARYEASILEAGGLDFQLLGIGRNGHIGFNEPGSARESRTRLVTLDSLTRADAADEFFGLENVPVRAISMGLATILEARQIALVASGARKAPVLAKALEGQITSKTPASFLREHPAVTFWLDRQAASQLDAVRAPWNCPDADFDDFTLRKRALVAISHACNVSIPEVSLLHLTQNGAARLATSEADLGLVKKEVIADLRARMNAEAILPMGKTVLCLSPHPDDDVICCGAVLSRLTADNRVWVAYGVSGANAVRDKDVLALLRARHPRLISFLEKDFEPGRSLEDAVQEVRTSIFEREPGAPDAPLLRELKRLVREGEASDACRKMGAKPLFLDLPFYGNGAQRAPVGTPDVGKMRALLETVRPDIVLLTGEHNDPHGTHEMCERAFQVAALDYGGDFARWSYRGAWDDYRVEEGDFFFVFDKSLMDRKINLILDHISQLDPLFPGSQPLEFWERARNRNRENARQLQRLGLLPASRSFDPLYVEVFQIKNSVRASQLASPADHHEIRSQPL